MKPYEAEEWRYIPGFGLNQASSLGRIRNPLGYVFRKGDYIFDEDVVPNVRLVDDQGFAKVLPVWYFVAKTFFDNFEDSYGVSFMDDDVMNTNPSNLIFTSKTPDGLRLIYPEISIDSSGKLHYKIDKRSVGRVMVVETGEIFNSASAAAKAINGQQPNVHGVLNGTRLSHKGYTFRYV